CGADARPRPGPVLAGGSAPLQGPGSACGMGLSGGLASGVTVGYATSDGSARAWRNYKPTSGTLTFDDGETSRTFTVPILDDGVPGGNKSLNLTLTRPGGGATLDSRVNATLWIVGNE